MKKELLSTVAVAALSLIPALSHAQTDTSSFGTIPGSTASLNNGNPYSGMGIPYNRSEITTITGIPNGDTLTLAMAITAHGSSNPAPSDNGNGTYDVLTGTGTSGTRSVWNYDYWISSTGGDLSDYTFELTVAGNGMSYTYDPVTQIGDNVGAPAAGNSESLDFTGTPFGSIDYNPNEPDTYTFTLTALLDNTQIGSDEVTAVSSVPEPTTVAAGVMMLLPLGFGALRTLRNRKAQSLTVIG